MSDLTVNGVLFDSGKEFIADEGTLLIYQMANTDKKLNYFFFC